MSVADEIKTLFDKAEKNHSEIQDLKEFKARKEAQCEEHAKMTAETMRILKGPTAAPREGVMTKLSTIENEISHIKRTQIEQGTVLSEMQTNAKDTNKWVLRAAMSVIGSILLTGVSVGGWAWCEVIWPAYKKAAATSQQHQHPLPPDDSVSVDMSLPPQAAKVTVVDTKPKK